MSLTLENSETEQEHEIAVVKEIREGRTIVELKPAEVCESCGARIFCRPSSKDRHEMAVQNTLNARPGDVVELSEMGNLLLILSLMQYGLPLLGLIGGIFLINGIKPDLFSLRLELLMAAGGFIGLLAGGIIARLWLERLSRTISSIFEITAVHSPVKHR